MIKMLIPYLLCRIEAKLERTGEFWSVVQYHLRRHWYHDAVLLWLEYWRTGRDVQRLDHRLLFQ